VTRAVNDALLILAPALAACVVLTGMHAYLGIHILQRGVIFVDLALAQMAALGATVGYLAGFDLHSTECYVASLTFALLGALLLASLRQHAERVPLEALIGILYAVGGAGAVLVLSRAPEGGEELRNLLVGHLLFLRWSEIIEVTILYGLIGVLHWKLRSTFLLISEDAPAAQARGVSVRGYDALFYGLFALVVTSSVEMAGVLLVFSFLVAPSICGALLGQSVRTRLFIGWFIGAFASVVGLGLSYVEDLPTGAAVVVVLGACVAAALLLQRREAASPAPRT